MPVILAVLGALMSGIFLWIVWGNGIQVINHWIDGFQARKRAEASAQQVARARNSLQRAPIRAIDDPREGATVLLIRLALARGDLTAEQRDCIRKIATQKLGIDSNVDNLMTLAEFNARQAPSDGEVVGDLVPLFHKCLNPSEEGELLAMMDEVAALHGGAGDRQRALIESLKLALSRRPQI